MGQKDQKQQCSTNDYEHGLLATRVMELEVENERLKTEQAGMEATMEATLEIGRQMNCFLRDALSEVQAQNFDVSTLPSLK